MAAQVVGRARDNAFARLPRGIDGVLSGRRPRYIQQLNPAPHAGTEHRAQQLDIAHGIGMRSEVVGQVDHAIELVGLVQVLQQLFPRSMRRRLIAPRIVGSYNLNMIPGKRLSAKVVVNIRSVANNQHLHGAPLP